jgi:predicted dehydrogenase
MQIKVLGAGSIGNHLSNAARRMGWQVDIYDTDLQALERTKNQIYPSRYGAWDSAIGLYKSGEGPADKYYDMVFVGTPPDSHIALAREAVKSKPKAVLVEKPFCTPDLAGAQDLVEEAASAGTHVFVGYDHVVGRAARKVAELLASGLVGRVETLDVEFREYWGGIFAAHPWLDGPADTYLGFWRRGGGACGEHSHALNLWQYFAHAAGLGRINKVQAALTYERDGKVDYDDICLLNVTTESGLLGRIAQDVVTEPPRKWARIQGKEGFIEWHCNYEPGVDLVRYRGPGKETGELRFGKTRPDDFVQEMLHIEGALKAGAAAQSPLSITRGLESMMVIAAAHKVAENGASVLIDYTKGFRPTALS